MTSEETDGRGAGKGRRGLGKKLMVGLVLLAGAAFVVPALASAGGGDSCDNVTPEQVRERLDWGADKIFGKLDATDAQRAAIDPNLDVLAVEIVNMKNEGKALKESMLQLVLADELDTEALEQVRAESVALIDRMSKQMVTDVTALHGILTPEQRGELRAFGEKMHERKRSRRGKHGFGK